MLSSSSCLYLRGSHVRYNMRGVLGEEWVLLSAEVRGVMMSDDGTITCSLTCSVLCFTAVCVCPAKWI